MLTDFSVHLTNCGYRLAEPLIADGVLRRIAWLGRPAYDKTGWYVAHVYDDWAAVAWGDWRDGRSEVWCSREKRRMTPTARVVFERDMKAAKETLEEEQAKARKAAVSRAWTLWSRADLDLEHSYLYKKKILGRGLRVYNGELIVPLRDADGFLGNVQRISPDGQKRFVKAAAVSGLAWVPTKLPDGSGDVVICEGVATAATVRALAGCAVVAAMNAGNLEAVAAWVRQKCPEARIIIAADDDRWEKDGTPRPAEKNVGLVKARAAAAPIRGLVVAPEFANMASPGTDWNDLWCEEGETSARDKWVKALKVVSLDAQLAVMPETEFHRRKPELTAAYVAAGAGKIGPKLLDQKRKEVAAAVAQTEADTLPAAVLARLIAEVDLWHDQYGQAFATFSLDGRRVNAKVEGQLFRDWLRMAYEDEMGSAVPPGREMVSACIEQTASRARSRGRRQQSFVRVGWDGDTRYLDLGRDDWSVVKFDHHGWEVTTEPSVKFTRDTGDIALPIPVRNDLGLAPLWEILNVAEEDRCLIAGWLLGCLMGNAPAFALALHGAQGTAKTMATQYLRRLVDPSPTLTQDLDCSKVDELTKTCLNQWIPCFDNISWLEDAIQDWLCKLTSGAGQRTRKLYTDDTINNFNVRRPWIINGINNVCSRNDLAERAVPVGLQVIKSRLTEKETEKAFVAAHAGLIAVLLDAACIASDPQRQGLVTDYLAGEGHTHRMADALLWITAGEESMGFETGCFIRRLNSLQEDAGREALESFPVVLAIQDLLNNEAEKQSAWTIHAPVEWTGSSEQLLSAVVNSSPGNKLPKGCEDVRKLGMWLKREASRLLQSFGIEIGPLKGVREKGNSKMSRARTITRREIKTT